MSNFSKWDNEEVKTLFKFVEIKKSEGMALINIFNQYASLTQRKQNSVRNYYYKELLCMTKNTQRAKELQIDLTNHSVNRGVPFTKSEEETIVKKISELVEQGCSVRKACLKLSNGNVPTMLRLQNKYRSITKINEKPMGQIIKMPIKNQKITEEDIKALFMGLVKMVKRQEQENIKVMYENELFKANEKLKMAFAEIVIKQNQIEKLKEEICLVKNKLNQNKECLIKKRIIQNKNSATNAIKDFFGKKTTKQAKSG